MRYARLLESSAKAKVWTPWKGLQGFFHAHLCELRLALGLPLPVLHQPQRRLPVLHRLQTQQQLLPTCCFATLEPMPRCVPCMVRSCGPSLTACMSMAFLHPARSPRSGLQHSRHMQETTE